MLLRITCAWAVILAACGGATAPASHTAVARGAMRGSAPLTCSGSVTLHFAWPDRLQATLSAASWLRDRGEDYPSPTQILAMQVAPDGSAHRVHFDTLRGGTSLAHGFLPSMAGTLVDVLVRGDGGVDRIEGGNALRQAAVRMAQEQHVDAEQAQLVGEALGDEWMLAHARDYWELFGKTWSGRTLTCGTHVTFHAPSIEMNLGHVAADVRTDLEWLGMQPCPLRPSGPAAGTCAHLRATQTTALPRTPVDASGTPHRLDLQRRTELIVEPATLVPRAIRFAEESRVDGASEIFTELVEEYVFDYAQPDAHAAPPRHDAILAMQQPNGHLFFWPADANGQPVRLPDTPVCRQLQACCQALSTASDAHGLLCATMVMSMPGSDCGQAMVMAVITVALNEETVPAECRGGPPAEAPARRSSGSST